MSKKKVKETAEPEQIQGPPSANPEMSPGTLPSEAETAPKSAGSEGVKEEKAPQETPKKKKPDDEIVGLMGVRHVPGPPGSWHG
jgi:hypothetical protein